MKPVAWHEPGAYSNVTVYEKWANENGWLPLYTAPPQRQWQGLTDEDIEKIHYDIKCKGMGAYSTNDIYRAIEAKLKEKNT